MPAGVKGGLYLHSLPGRYEPWDEALAALRTFQISRLVSLMPDREALEKSSFYARAAERNALPCTRTVVAVKEYDVPLDRETFFQLVDEVATSIRGGERVLAHCAAGRGRTGMFAICVLIALGYRRRDAERVVARAGSAPESPDQKRLVAAMAQRNRRGLFARLRRRLTSKRS